MLAFIKNTANNIYAKVLRSRWELGLIYCGVEQILNSEYKLKKSDVHWIKNPYKDRWFADPFILDVTNNYVTVLAEEMRFGYYNGRIAKLLINRRTMVIEKMTIVLELNTHLSFPFIIRKDGKVFVSPENCLSGKQDLYEYDEETQKLIFVKTICDDMIWDAAFTEHFGKLQMFTANKDDKHLDIYNWDERKQRFIPSQTINSDSKNMRMAGALLEYKGEIYCPCQDCNGVYGGAVIIKKVEYKNDVFKFSFLKRITSPNIGHNGCHTLNSYKNVMVIDAHRYENRIIAPILKKIVHFANKVL